MFSGNNNSFGMFNINFSDYAAISNGSYRRLLTAHYALDNKTSKSRTVTAKDWVVNKADRYGIDEDTKEKDKDTEVNPEKKAYNTVQTNAQSLKSATDKLTEVGSKSVFNKVEVKDEAGETSMQYDTDAIYKAIKSFADNYNNTITSGAETKSDNVNRTVRAMINYTKANQSALSAVGIEIGKDNKLTVNEDKFKSADMERVQNLFSGRNSYGSQISSQADLMNKYAKSAAAATSTYTQSGKYNYFDYSAMFNSSI